MAKATGWSGQAFKNPRAARSAAALLQGPRRHPRTDGQQRGAHRGIKECGGRRTKTHRDAEGAENPAPGPMLKVKMGRPRRGGSLQRPPAVPCSSTRQLPQAVLRGAEPACSLLSPAGGGVRARTGGAEIDISITSATIEFTGENAKPPGKGTGGVTADTPTDPDEHN